MGIEARHAYRFGYLKSEKWGSVRLEALVRADGKCKICQERSSSNDAHHIWYPENIYDTTPEHLVILCRPCHEFVHAMMPECKAKEEGMGMDMWLKFYASIMKWRGVGGGRSHQKFVRSCYAVSKRANREAKNIEDDTRPVLTIHIADRIIKGPGPYRCDTTFRILGDFSKLLSTLPYYTPSRPVFSRWNKRELYLRAVSVMSMQCNVYSLIALHLKGLPLYEEDWSDERKMFGKAVMAYIDNLPDKWHCFLALARK